MTIDGHRRFSQEECLFLVWQLLEPVAVDVSVLLQHMHVCLKIDYHNGKLRYNNNYYVAKAYYFLSILFIVTRFGHDF